jgi:hypothetical protein
MLVILIALLIVAWLSKDALKKYGMLDGGSAVTKRSAGQGAPAGTDAEPATPSNAMEKAKALEGLLQRESAKRDGGN